MCLRTLHLAKFCGVAEMILQFAAYSSVQRALFSSHWTEACKHDPAFVKLQCECKQMVCLVPWPCWAHMFKLCRVFGCELNNTALIVRLTERVLWRYTINRKRACQHIVPVLAVWLLGAMSFLCLLALVEIGSVLLQNVSFLDTCILTKQSTHNTTESTRYRLNGLGIESRWAARFSTSVQAGPETYPSSYTTGTASFLG